LLLHDPLGYPSMQAHAPPHPLHQALPHLMNIRPVACCRKL
jgi:hypothetical protein